MYGNGTNKSWLEMSDQERLNQMFPQPCREHQIEHMIEDAVFWTVVLYVLGWLVNRVFHRPIASLVFVASCAGVVLTADNSLTVPCWMRLITALVAFDRVVR